MVADGNRADGCEDVALWTMPVADDEAVPAFVDEFAPRGEVWLTSSSMAAASRERAPSRMSEAITSLLVGRNGDARGSDVA